MVEFGALANEALDLCERLMSFAEPFEIAEAFQCVIARFGLDHFIITDIPGVNQRFEQAVVLRCWPSGWFEVYAGKNFVRTDPVIRLCRSTTALFDWTEAPYDSEREPHAREVMRCACDFGLVRGLSLPIHGLDGLETCFSVSGQSPELTQRTRPALHLMMMYAFERLCQVATHEATGANPLTQRERDVLCWAANGKSAAETAELLAITERTVNAHAGAAIAKLGASNRTQAVVRAMKHRYIRV